MLESSGCRLQCTINTVDWAASLLGIFTENLQICSQNPEKFMNFWSNKMWQTTDFHRFPSWRAFQYTFSHTTLAGCFVLCLDLFSIRSNRTPSQRACLKWSNICSLFYSILESFWEDFWWQFHFKAWELAMCCWNFENLWDRCIVEVHGEIRKILPGNQNPGNLSCFWLLPSFWFLLQV